MVRIAAARGAYICLRSDLVEVFMGYLFCARPTVVADFNRYDVASGPEVSYVMAEKNENRARKRKGLGKGQN